MHVLTRETSSTDNTPRQRSTSFSEAYTQVGTFTNIQITLVYYSASLIRLSEEDFSVIRLRILFVIATNAELPCFAKYGKTWTGISCSKRSFPSERDSISPRDTFPNKKYANVSLRVFYYIIKETLVWLIARFRNCLLKRACEISRENIESWIINVITLFIAIHGWLYR